MKLPEPEGKIAYELNEYECEWISSQDAYTADQMRQMRIDALEEAALACEKRLETGAHLRCATDIRALKELSE